MANNLRTHYLNTLYSEDQNTQIIVGNVQKRQAEEELEAAREAYENARAKLLAQDYARFFRIAVFGSARLEEKDSEYQEIKVLAKMIVEARPIDIVTGGGPGVMKAANEGLSEVLKENINYRAKNHGITVSLPFEEMPNEDIHIRSHHPEFSLRLQEFLDKTKGAYIAPGGIGTLLEKLICVQSKQVGHLEEDYKIIAHPFFRKIIDDINDELYHQRLAEGRKLLISEKELYLVNIISDIEQVVQEFTESYDHWKKNINSRVRVVNDTNKFIPARY